MNCDCGHDDVLELGDGVWLCLQCRAELELTGGAFCRAHSIRRQVMESGEQYAAEEVAAEEWLDEFSPAQGSCQREAFSRQEENVWRPRPIEVDNVS